MTLEELVALVGIVVSLLFSYFPGIQQWFEPLPSNTKRLLQVAVAVVVSGAVFGLGCAGLAQGFACSVDGAIAAVRLLVVFIVTNQAAYAITKR